MIRQYAVYLTLVWTFFGTCFFIQTFADSDGVDFFLASVPEAGTHVIRPDGERLLYYPQGMHIHPRISPDRGQLLLNSRRGGRIGIWLGDFEGKELRRLCDGDQADWSPDGKKIVFRREGRIVERDLATGEERNISSPEFSSCMFPSYLSEGHFLFVSHDSLYTTGGGSRTQRLLATGEIRSAPRASGDGLKVVWQDGAHLTLLDLKSGRTKRLTTQGGIQSWPVWSEDGEYLAYCQSPLPEGPWDLYVAAADNPEKTWLIRRGIHPGFDWIGGHSPDTAPTELVRGQLSVLTSNSPSGGQSNEKIGRLERDQWQRLDVQEDAIPLIGDAIIENSWLAASLSSHSNSFSLFLREELAASSLLEIAPLLTDRAPLDGEPAVQLKFDDPDYAQLQLLYSSGGSVIDIQLTFPAFRSFIELKCSGAESLSLRTKTKLVLIPDRLGNDLLLDPQTCRSSEITLPYAPLLLAPLREESGMLVILTPEQSQKVELRSGPRSFEEIVISPGAEKIFVALLPGTEHWQQLEVKATDKQEQWQADWTHPFLAQWRIAAREGDSWYSRMWGEESLGLQNTSFLPIARSFGSSPHPAVIYLFGRSWHTPLHVITLMDFLVDSVGFEKGYRLLDDEGIRSYRMASRPVSFREITTREEKWNRELVHVDSRDPNWVELGVLESMQGLRASDTPGVRSLITHFGEDIISILEGLDNRIKEYELFLDQLRAFCRSNQNSSEIISEYLAALIQQAAIVETRVQRLPVSSIKPLENVFSEILGSLGSSKYLHSTEGYDRLSKVVRASQTERLDVVREYREYVKTVRNRSTQAAIDNPGMKAVVDELHKMTATVLRNRYYLENDWSGEVPLRKDTD